ncbi:MAG: hypothetical protein GAK28_01325 [Luteibacter sp.]|nr:MAG: hypothetical protein GAK28_01325 [Luteibacter sp.]
MKVFQTSMSTAVRWTGLLTVVFAIIVVAVMASRPNGTFSVPLAGLLLVILSIAYAMSPLRYDVGDGQLVVRRQVGRVSAELRGATIESDPAAFRGLVRTFGNGGFFAVHGMYWSRRLGAVRVYARNRDHGVVLTLASGRKWLLSPDDPDAFIAAVRAWTR